VHKYLLNPQLAVKIIETTETRDLQGEISILKVPLESLHNVRLLIIVPEMQSCQYCEVYWVMHNSNRFSSKLYTRNIFETNSMHIRFLGSIASLVL
jgi:hypothetical protein